MLFQLTNPAYRRYHWLMLVLSLQWVYLLINRTMTGGMALKTPLDAYIPLWPGWVVFYLLALPAWFLVYCWAVWRLDDVTFKALALASTTVMLICYACFLFFPTYVERPVLADDDPLSQLLQWVYQMDRVNNAFPSQHVALTGVLGLQRGRRYAWLWVGATILVILSTLFTHQHHLLDVIGGLLVAGIGWCVGHWVATKPTSLATASAEAQSTLAARRAVMTGIETQIVPLRQLNLSRRLRDLTIFATLWLTGAALALYGHSLPTGLLHNILMITGIFAAAIALNANVLLLHEGMHHTLFASRPGNDGMAVLLGATTLISFTAYRVLHLRHHRFLGDPGDPDDYRNYTSNRRLIWLMHYLRLTVGAFVYILLIPFLAWRFATPQERRQIAIEYALMFAAYAFVLALVPFTSLRYAWLLPLLLVAYMTGIRGFTQHGITDAEDPFIASRTIQANPIVAFCLLSENYHLEHHLFPEIPSYNLEKLHQLIWPRLPRAVTDTSYVGFLGKFVRASFTLDESPIGLVLPGQKQ